VIELALVALILAAFAATIAAVRARARNRALHELRDTAAAMAAGNLDARGSLAMPGELGDLAGALRRIGERVGPRVAALEAEDALLAGLIESLNEGVLAVDAREQVVRVNRAGRELLGLGDAQVPFSTDRLPRDLTLHGAVQQALTGETVGPLEVAVGGRTLVVTARPISGNPGGPSAVLALFDLTQLRRLEQIRRDFVANVSHELRTPLTVVGGFAEALAEGGVAEDQRLQFTDAIRVHTARMQRIVDDLLDLSRIESGGWVPTPEPVDVALIAAEAVAAITPEAQIKGVDVRLEADASLPPLHVDRTALRQVLANLLENSVKHTAGGEVVVFATQAANGTRIGVRDTGSGIPAHHLPRIFERFYRADPARARQSGGTGLGLAIVKHLVEAHGGSVSAESEVGVGTTITAVFPEASG
jgi:two-component system phosphate regulon sensor histidine kinase PhoR